MNYYLAIDIGASSGRHIVGWLEDGEIKAEEVYRFPNSVKTENNHLVWDTEDLFNNVKQGIKVALDKYPEIASLAIDTWGVDYVLLNGDKPILPCYAYRDGRTEKAIDEVHKIIAFEKLYSRTGIQFQPFNTIYQLYCDKMQGRLDKATDFLMMPEYLSYLLTGVKKHEYTNATTMGLVNAVTGEYDREIISKLDLPEGLFTKTYQPGTVVGKLKSEIAQEVGGQIEVVLCATHDTASAVEGIPIEGDSPYISSGTWSLLGLKVPKAITDTNSCSANYSNEGGVGYIRYQKNIMGMWVVNRLKAEICPEKPFPQIVEEARQSEFAGFVDVNESVFLAPDSMKEAFDSHFFVDERPKTDGDYFRCAFLSLAHSYKTALTELKRNSGKDFDTLYIVGGGAKNTLLNELTEKICNIKVKALPIEATAIGNLKIQIARN
ncbi:MAG: rhamnulokinase family protein [Candidatus Coproplasma sp.]